MSAIAFSRAIGPVPIDVVVTERHKSDIEITEIPIENGARITDHAFILPKKITLEGATGNATAAFNALVALQESRVPFTLVTGFYVYRNMLIKSISADRDKQFSTVLKFTADLQEIIIVSTSYVADPGGGGNNDPNNNSPSKLDPSNSGDPATQDRTTRTNLRGDTGTTTVTPGDDTSLLRRVYG